MAGSKEHHISELPMLKPVRLKTPTCRMARQVEEPDTEQHAGFGEVREGDCHRVNGKGKVGEALADADNLAAEHGHGHIQDGYAPYKPGRDVPAEDGDDQPESESKQARPDQGRQTAFRAGNAREFKHGGGDRERQAFVVHPLFPQDDDEAEADGEHGSEKSGPP